jgi:DNA repair exonuclease SbcCD ATPase subunit
MNVEELYDKCIQLDGIRKDKQQEYSKNRISIAKEKRRAELLEMARATVIKIGEDTQNEIKNYIEETITFAIQTVYGEQFKFVVNFNYDKRDQFEIQFFINRNGILLEPRKNTISGGLTDVCAFSLRMVLFSLEDEIIGIIILDEPFKNVSKSFIPLVSQMVKELSDLLELQLIICSHTDEIIELADQIIQL